MQVIRATAGQWITDNMLVADIHGGEVAVVVLTEIRDSREDGEKLAERILRVRRARVRREKCGEGDNGVAT
ncbi:MAG: hypothetical protein JW829_21415 [Pirellulales bacterium]|nr:hypothetical protein [Pirellulales bacterium]